MKDLFFKKQPPHMPAKKRDKSGEVWDKSVHDKSKNIWVNGRWLKDITKTEKEIIKNEVPEIFNVPLKEKNEIFFKQLEERILLVYLNKNKEIFKEIKTKYGLTSFRSLKIDTSTLVKILHDLEQTT